MNTVDVLKNKTVEFFNLHWPKDNDYPYWSDIWRFLGTIPNNDKQGCYALIKDNKVVYMGVGASKGSGIYTGAGLGNRLHKYWRKKGNNKQNVDSREYKPSKKYKNKIDGIITLGFDKYNYLALALELFLIRELKPTMNVIGKNI